MFSDARYEVVSKDSIPGVDQHGAYLKDKHIAKWFTNPPSWKVGKLTHPKAIKRTQEEVTVQATVSWKFKFTEEGRNPNRAVIPKLKLFMKEYGAEGMGMGTWCVLKKAGT